MRRGFTLVEVLIAISLFVLTATIASNILINISNLEKKTNIQNVIYEDIRILLTQLGDFIERGNIDYEEYYSIKVIQHNEPEKYYGLFNGIYSSRFYSPGLFGDSLGTICSDLNYPNSCNFIMQDSVDLSTGKNPYNDSLNEANAFCDENVIQDSCNDGNFSNKVEELYLVDQTGTKKLIVARKKISNDQFALAVLEMEGYDYDQNGIVDLFSCTEDFTCEENVSILDNYPFVDIPSNSYDIKLAKQSNLNLDLDINNTQFIPITPLRINITELSFTINPVENPYLAYNELDNLYHPTVTIKMTVDLSESEEYKYPGEFEPIEFETTISAGVIGDIRTYPPIEDLYGKNESSWIDNLF